MLYSVQVYKLTIQISDAKIKQHGSIASLAVGRIGVRFEVFYLLLVAHLLHHQRTVLQGIDQKQKIVVDGHAREHLRWREGILLEHFVGRRN